MEEAIWRLEEKREALEAKIQDLNQRLTMHR
jgi:prefoldin subunit 5